MNELEDIKLRAILQEMKLEKPKADFTVKVMNKIFEENIVLERIKSERILGKGFWIFTFTFAVLLAVILISSNTAIQSESQIQNLLPEVNHGISSGYQTFFEKMGTVPLGIAGILIASSLLLFIDRIISANSKIFS